MINDVKPNLQPALEVKLMLKGEPHGELKK